MMKLHEQQRNHKTNETYIQNDDEIIAPNTVPNTTPTTTPTTNPTTIQPIKKKC